MAHDVFISYSSKDKTTADAACAVLEAKGLRCWIAPRDIRPGADWGEAIVDAINEARVFVLIFSGNANASVQIKREVERAINKAVPVIPFRIENVMPAKSLEYFLSTPHWLDAFTPPLQQHLDYLAAISRSILDGQAAPERPIARSASVPIDRRLLIGGAGGAAALALIGYWAFPKGPPSMTGRWTAEAIKVPPDAPSPFAAFPINAFYKAALASNSLTGRFELDETGAYRFAWGGHDRGRITLAGRSATFVSDLTKKSATMSYGVLNPPPNGAIAALGGESDDAALALSSPGSAQALLLGKPQGGSLAGRWSTRTQALGLLPAISTALEIAPDLAYRFQFEFEESGMFRTDGGTFTRERPGQPPVTGTLTFDGKDRVSIAAGGGVTIWVRDR